MWNTRLLASAARACVLLVLLSVAAAVAADHESFHQVSAGPDGFGYTLDGTIPFQWEDVPATGTQLPTPLDSGLAHHLMHVWGPIDLPPGFEFQFYGEAKTQVWVSAVGLLLFTDPATYLDPGVLADCCRPYEPPPLEPTGTNYHAKDFVALNAIGWDLRSGGCGEIYHEALDLDTFIIHFETMCPYPSSYNAGPSTMQVRLINRTNDIEVHYLRIPDSGSIQRSAAIAGMEGPDETWGLAYFGQIDNSNSHSAQGLTDEAVRYDYPALAPEPKDDGDADEDGDVEDDAYHATRHDPSLLLDVLANDADPNGDPLSIAETTEPSYGSATVEDGQVRYELNVTHDDVQNLANEAVLLDTFTYTVEDPEGKTATAKITVHIEGKDHVPVFKVLSPVHVSEHHPDEPATTIDGTHVRITDEDDPNRGTQLRVTAVPKGTLLLSNASVAVGDVFDAGDLEDGNLTYKALASDPVGDPPHALIGLKVFDPDDEDALAVDGGATQWISIHVAAWDDPPTAVFRHTPGPHYTGLGVRFHDLSMAGDEPIGARAWDLGDGHTETGRLVDHIYTTPGTYQVTLTITEGAHNVTTEMELEVLQHVPSQARFRADRTEVEVGEPVHFTDVTIAGNIPLEGRVWELDDAVPLNVDLTTPELEHRFTEAGRYVVTLTVFDIRGLRYDAQGIIHVHDAIEREFAVVERTPKPDMHVDAGPDRSVAAGAVVRVTGEATTGADATYTWRHVGGAVLDAVETDTLEPYFRAPWIDGDLEAVYRLEVRQGLQVATDDVRIVVLGGQAPGPEAVPEPDAAFTWTIEGDVLRLQAPQQEAPQAAYTWTLDGKPIGSTNLLEHRLTDPGVFVVHLEVVDALGRTAHHREAVTAAAGGSEPLAGPDGSSDAVPGWAAPFLVVLGFAGAALILGVLLRRSARARSSPHL